MRAEFNDSGRSDNDTDTSHKLNAITVTNTTLLSGFKTAF